MDSNHKSNFTDELVTKNFLNEPTSPFNITELNTYTYTYIHIYIILIFICFYTHSAKIWFFLEFFIESWHCPLENIENVPFLFPLKWNQRFEHSNNMLPLLSSFSFQDSFPLVLSILYYIRYLQLLRERVDFGVKEEDYTGILDQMTWNFIKKKKGTTFYR